MKPKPDSVKKLFNLDKNAANIITDGAKLNNMNMTDFVEFLAFHWAANFSPKKRLETLQKEKSLAKKTEYLLEKKIKKAEKEIEMITTWKITKEVEKGQITRNLARMMNEKRWNDAERIAIIQSKRFGVPAVELLTTALKYTNK